MLLLTKWLFLKATAREMQYLSQPSQKAIQRHPPALANFRVNGALSLSRSDPPGSA